MHDVQLGEFVLLPGVDVHDGPARGRVLGRGRGTMQGLQRGLYVLLPGVAVHGGPA